MSRHVAVVGAGAVGARVARRLLAEDADVTVSLTDVTPGVAARLATQLGERVQAVDPAAAESGAANGTRNGSKNGPTPDVVVLAQPRPHAPAAARAIAHGSAVVSVGDAREDVGDLLSLGDAAAARQVPVVVGAGCSPGLSGMLARHLAGRLEIVDEIHVAVHGTGGPACARQHHEALGAPAIGWHDGRWVERPGGSGRELCWFPEPLGAWDCYRSDLADPLVLVRAFPGVGRVTARMSANRRDRLTARLPMLSPPHREGGLGGLRVEVRGSRHGERVTLVAGVAERTAIVAAGVASVFALAALDRRLPPGVVLPADAGLDTRSLLERVVAAGLALREFVGTDGSTSW